MQAAVEASHEHAAIERAAFGEQRYEVPVYPVPRGRAIDQGELLAEQERRRLGLGSGPVPSMVGLLEREGVKVLVRHFSPESSISGCYFFTPEVGPCVVINANEALSRRRFTAAHEYAHVLVERADVPAEVCATGRRAEFTEMRANAFAAVFLLPPGGIRRVLTDLGVGAGEVQAEHAVHLMYHFGVSYRAVLWRLLNLGWISADQRQELDVASPTSLAKILGYGGREPGGTEGEPERLRTIAVEAWRAGELSLGCLADIVGLSEESLRRVLPHTERSQPRPARAPAAEPDWL